TSGTRPPTRSSQASPTTANEFLTQMTSNGQTSHRRRAVAGATVSTSQLDPWLPQDAGEKIVTWRLGARIRRTWSICATRSLGERALREHRFDWLRGYANRRGFRSALPVDAYYPHYGLVIES